MITLYEITDIGLLLLVLYKSGLPLQTLDMLLTHVQANAQVFCIYTGQFLTRDIPPSLTSPVRNCSIVG